MNPTNKPITIQLNGKKERLLFDLNTFVAFETVSKDRKPFLDFLAVMQDALAAVQVGKEGGFSLLRRLYIEDVRALLWAALHKYDADDEPVWPYTLSKIGRMVDVNNITTIVSALMTGSAENMPRKEESEPRAEAEDEDRPPAEAQSAENAGGSPFGPSDDDVLALVTEKSEG